ncbi:MAG TPA: glycosyltransferase, partial [Bacilli bacterium]|nr:glycosyltransferase [Bacilli bacterium]
MNDLISIIVPVYNTEKYLSRCLDSIINQSYKNIEIILVNDGSKDNSLSIINEYSKKDSRIIVLDQKNQGVTKARFNGYNISHGKYIMFVDSDDWIELNTLDIMYKRLLEDKTDLVKCDYKKYRNNKYYFSDIIKEDKIINNNEIFDYLYSTICFNGMNMQLMKRELLKLDNINYELKYGEDLRIMMDILRKVSNVSLIINELYIYNINDESITNSKEISKVDKKIIDCIKVYEDLYNYTDIYNLDASYKYKAITKILFYFCYHLINGKLNKKNFYELYNKNIILINKYLDTNYDLIKDNLNSYSIIYKKS